MKPDSYKRFFNGLPVVDAKKPIQIHVNDIDVKQSKRKSPTECVIAKACKRLFKAREVMILRRTAYVDLPGPGRGGRRQFKRFIIDRNVSEKIGVFDKTGQMDTGGFTLLPPSPSMTLERLRKSGNQRKEAIEAGKHKVKHRRKSHRITAPRTGTLEVRNGTGRAHFATTRA